MTAGTTEVSYRDDHKVRSIRIPTEFRDVRIDWKGTDYFIPVKGQVWEDVQRPGRLLHVLEVEPKADSVTCEVLPFGRPKQTVTIRRNRMKPDSKGYKLKAKSLWL